MLRSRIVECIALLMLTTGATSAEVQTPSFDCARASAPDERAICTEPQLAALDRLIADGYRQLKDRLGTTVANQIHLPFLRARRACGGNAFCIFERQTEEIPSFQALGVTLTTPSWLDASPPPYPALKRMLNVGECSAATIQDIGYRLCSPDESNVCIPSQGSGTSVTLSNGIYGVSYDPVPEVHASQAGDPVIACLAEIPKDCPAGDDRGYVWSVTNLRTKGHWQLPDAQQECGCA